MTNKTLSKQHIGEYSLIIFVCNKFTIKVIMIVKTIKYVENEWFT